MDCSTTGFPVHHQLLELVQARVHRVGDVIQPSHLLSSPSPPAFNLSQHQGLFQWFRPASDGQSIGASASASVLPMNIQDWFSLGLTGLISLNSKRLPRVFYNTTVQKHQFFNWWTHRPTIKSYLHHSLSMQLWAIIVPFKKGEAVSSLLQDCYED